MTKMTAPPELGVHSNHGGKGRGWVQTERKAHEEWSKLCIRKPIAAAVLHRMVQLMGHQNAVVVPQKVLSEMLGVHERSIRRAISDLGDERWIQVVRIGKGREAAYIVNDCVAWGQPRDQLRLSVFSAAIVASADDQDAATLAAPPLRRIPTLYPGERQLPSGAGEDPPSQPHLEGLEPDLPALAGDAADRAKLEKLGQGRLLDE